MGHFPFNIGIFIFNSFISLFIVFSVSLWCLFRIHMSSFICFCVFSCSLFLLSCNFLSTSWTFWLIMCSNIFTNSQWLLAGFLFSGCSCGLPWVPWHSLSLFCWSLEVGICFLHFLLNHVLIYFLGENFFHPFFIFPLFHLVPCNNVLDRLLITCFLSLGLILFCGCVGF
jgi:hypothetical protein